MRQIYKDIIVGFILASFTFAPAAFARPRTVKMQKASKAPGYLKMQKAIRSSKKGLKVSTLIESAEGMIKRREFKDVRKLALPYWDKKFDKVTVGKDYFKIKFKGYSLFARYVDRGSVAFMVNNQPLLWKDFLNYRKMKVRLAEILTGKKRKARKVSSIDLILNAIFPQAHAKTTEANCQDGDIPGAQWYEEGFPEGDDSKGCYCTEGLKKGMDPKSNLSQSDGNNGFMLTDPRPGCPADPAVGTTTPTPAPTEDEGKDNTMMWLMIGAAALLLLFLLMKKKKTDDDDDDDDDDPDPPVPGWTPESTCPEVGDRGMTEDDLRATYPQCYKSSCDDTDSCTGSSGIVR